ncbi:MAG: Mini-ribonuclease 3 [Clostridiales bacterium]|nr:Mini-ribonuclease 3 [Clostridiales bacterium]
MFNKIYNEMEINTMSPLIWAYIGDSVYEIFIREKMIEKGIPNNTKLHIETIKYVKAHAQSEILKMLTDFLTEYEHTIVKRGRNANSNTIPKHADVIEYKNATAFEGLIGYLFLTGKYERILEILNYVYENYNVESKKQ